MTARLGVSKGMAQPFRRLYVVGAGGAGREVAWQARESWGDATEIEFLVDDPQFLSGPVDGLPVRLLSEAAAEGAAYVVAMGDPVARRRAARACEGRGLSAGVVVHPRAVVSPWVTIDHGALICAGAVLTTNVQIREHVYINVQCTVSHDVTIGAYSTLSPGVHVAGNVDVGSEVFIGIGANIINGRRGAPLTVGDGAVIAAGACVTESVEGGSLVAGVPAVRKR